MGCFKYKYGCNYFWYFNSLFANFGPNKGPMANISGLIPKFYSMTASAERLMELENLPDEKELNQLENISSVYESMKNINIENISFPTKMI